MSLEANKALVRKFIDAYNQHDSDCVYTYLAPDYIDHTNQVDIIGCKICIDTV